MMNSSMEIKLYGPHEETLRNAAEEAFTEILRIENKLSPLQKDSMIVKINLNAGIRGIEADPELWALLEEAVRFSSLSQGCFDITVQGLAGLWNFHQAAFFPPGKNVINARLHLVDYRKIVFDSSRSLVFLKEKGMKISMGGIAKGYAADRAVKILRRAKIIGGVVSAGGDLKAFGTKEGGALWRVGVKNPRDDQKLILSLPITNAAVATSGDYERYRIVDGRRYHHIIDPRTGFPAQGCMSVTIVAKYAIEADALATAVFVMGPEAGLAFIESMPGIEGIIVDDKGELRFSSGLMKGQKELSDRKKLESHPPQMASKSLPVN